MKKVLVIALMLGAGLAYASSIGVPWFVDNADVGSNIPQTAKSVGLVFLHNNATNVLDITIAYYTQIGNYAGPTTDNSFLLNPGASIAFRPVQTDSAVEGEAYLLVPNRPRTTIPPGTPLCDTKKNGAIVLTWMGDPTDLSGSYRLSQCASHPNSATDTTLLFKLTGYGHLLPPGA